MPSVTGTWASLTQAAFEELAPDGGFLHFRPQFADPASQNPIFYRDPLTGSSTGQTVRQVIAAQVAQFGWPLTGIYISGSGNVPHMALLRSLWPAETGSPEARAEKLQNDLIVAAERVYKASQTVTDPTDPDFGQAFDVRNFWVGVKCWNYRSDRLYIPRSAPGVGDYAFIVSNNSPPVDWFKELN